MVFPAIVHLAFPAACDKSMLPRKSKTTPVCFVKSLGTEVHRPRLFTHLKHRPIHGTPSGHPAPDSGSQANRSQTKTWSKGRSTSRFRAGLDSEPVPCFAEGHRKSDGSLKVCVKIMEKREDEKNIEELNT